LIQKPVEHDGRVLMDGGIADPVPIRKSMADGNKRHVLVLTQPKGYRKKRSRLTGLMRLVYRRYPRLLQTLATRHVLYNETMDLIDRFEAERDVFVIRPTQPVAVRRTERAKDRLYALYDQGYADGQARYEELCSYLKGDADSPPHGVLTPSAL
jgi:predicted patatin/cPLA2 family phospholipase